MAYEIIRFTIADPLLSTLKGMATGDESLHLTAKRVITEILEGKQPTIEPDRLAELESKLEKLETQEVNPVAPDALEEIRDRLIDLEDLVRKEGDRLTELEKQWNIDTGDRLSQLEDQLSVAKKAVNALEQIPQEVHNNKIRFSELLNRTKALETGQPAEFNETIGNLVERIENLEGWISSLRDDRALAKGSLGKFSDRLDALEKKGKVKTAPREIPKGMTHKQIAEICDVSVYAVTKMAHDRSKWPEGYMWSDESKKWFPMEV